MDDGKFISVIEVDVVICPGAVPGFLLPSER